MPETIFILGAGASMPYGFPSGESLKNLIQEELGKLVHELQARQRIPGTLSYIIQSGHAINAELCHEFQQTLIKSGVYSIDAFLERRPKFRELGKMIISYLLLESERKCLDQNRLFMPEKPEENWYRYFFNEIKDLKRFNFKIYTFNYERSLEYYLIEAYRNLFDYSNEVIAERINAMNIIHLHGSLGAIDSANKVKWPNFGNTSMITNYDYLERLSHGIEIIYEVEGSKFQGLYGDIENSSNIVFIGFGFDKTNMKNLDLKSFLFPKREKPIFYASTYGLSDNEVQRRFLSHLKFHEPKTEIKMFPAFSPSALMNDPVVTADQTAANFFKYTLPHSIYTS